MGCTFCREGRSGIEHSIIFAESSFGYDKIDLSAFIDSLIKVSNGDQIPTQEMNNIAKQYGLALAKTHPEREIIDFYNTQFKHGKNYSLREMATFAVLLSKKRSQTKAKALFKAWTKDQGGIMDKETGTSLFEKLLDIPTLDMELLFRPSSLTCVDNLNYAVYAAKLETGREQSKILANRIFSDSPTLSEIAFVRLFINSENKKWLSSYGVRAELKSLGLKKLLEVKEEEGIENP
jgi:hypothetical protein